MKQMWSMAKKELGSYFVSPVALIFLAVFLFSAFYDFFWRDSFFLRNVADVRLLFERLPQSLILLCAALTMRSWSDEQRGGTLEILLTLPVKTHWLVLGKFLAALALVGVALLLTISLPISVSQLGQLDWGPVVGGYLAALLLAGAYLAIGLSISATTSYSVVALLVTLILNSILYGIGTESFAALFGNRGMEILQQIGIGSRFGSIERGVIDLRDIVYYGSLSLMFLTANVIVLEAKRWSRGLGTRPRRQALAVFAALLALNLVLCNVNLAPVQRLRLDLTQNGDFSVSNVTKKTLASLRAPLLIRGYFSEKTHPKLAPLVPQIRDKLREYAAIGGDKIVVEVVDPTKDKALEKEANDDYGIRPVTLQQKDRHQAAIVNSYFHLLVKYGDKTETLGFGDLIEYRFTGADKLEVRLKNIEYDLTRTVRKVVRGFTPLEELFSRFDKRISITHYITKKSLPKGLDKLPEWLAQASAGLKAAAGGKLTVKTVDPGGKGQDELRRTLLNKYNIQPRMLWGANEFFYLHTVLQVGDESESLYWAGSETSKTEVRRALESALKRQVPGFLKTVGLLVSKAKTPPMNPMMRQRPRPPRDRFRLLRRSLAETYNVKTVSLTDGRVPSSIDVLLIVGDGGITEKQRFAIDQFLMRGGSVVVCSGRYELDPMGLANGMRVKKTGNRLAELLAKWGVKIEDELVLDKQAEHIPVQVGGGLSAALKYAYWLDIRDEGMTAGALPLAGLPALTLEWASPITVKKQTGLKTEVLLSSSKEAWTSSNLDVTPDPDKYPETGFAKPAADKVKRRVLAVTASGSFNSYYAGKASPLDEQPDAPGTKDKTDKDKKDRKAKHAVIEKSGKGARLAVVGSSEFLSDDVFALLQQTGSPHYLSNLQLSQNLLDWALADTELLSIRHGGVYTRTLRPLDDGQRQRWEIANYLAGVLGLVAVALLAWLRRRSMRPIVVEEGLR